MITDPEPNGSAATSVPVLAGDVTPGGAPRTGVVPPVPPPGPVGVGDAVGLGDALTDGLPVGVGDGDGDTGGDAIALGSSTGTVAAVSTPLVESFEVTKTTGVEHSGSAGVVNAHNG
jgi:hypothetical protein